jgi:hypothetical protein
VEETAATHAGGPGGEPGLAPTDVYGRGDGVATRVVADETLVIPFKGTLASLQQLFALNPVAAFVWQRVDGRAPLDAILADILAAFEVGRERAWADLQELVIALREAGLVHQVESEPGGTAGA